MATAEPNRYRQEWPGVGVTICDYDKRKVVSLNFDLKQATVTDLASTPGEEAPRNFFEEVRAMLTAAQDEPNVRRESLGEKEIDGRRAIGYRITRPGQTMIIWGDPKTYLPIRVEWASKILPETKVTMTDFTFNADLDESLFSLEVPGDYTVRRRETDVTPPSEKDLIEMLRLYSDMAEGRFPDALDFRAVMGLVFKKRGAKKGEKPTDEQLRKQRDLTAKLNRGIVFAFLHLPPEADAHYAGRGVKRDTPDRPLFWYRPKGKKAYRVIYADLSVVEADTPPSVPGARPLSAESPPKE